MSAPIWLFLTVLLTVVVYFPGLRGPFVFDDIPNLRPLQDWLNGVASWQEALLANRSGLLGRPLSMLTFMANAEWFGMGSLSFKITNLAVHLLCGTSAFALLRRLLLRDPQLRPHAAMVAAAISAVWLLHPMQVSTVLYIVQRMAQLSTLFMLLALMTYVHGRERLEQRQPAVALAWLFLVTPALTIIGVLCKENAALVPLLCAVLELGYFNTRMDAKRPWSVRIFFLFGLILPLLSAALWLAWPPSRLVAGYTGRTFTLGQRLLSEPRALFDYISNLLLPRGPTLGLYTDDFVVSHGLAQPATTWLSLVGLAVLVGMALASRRHAPAVFTGISFFLAAHAMESSIFPLELYFEHRNYLPSIGLFLTLAGIINWALDKLPASTSHVPRSRWVLIGMIAVCAMLATATAARAWVWQSWAVMVKQGILHHPGSMRAQLDNLSVVWNTESPENTRLLLEQLARSDNPATRHLAVIASVQHECQVHHAIDPADLTHVASLAGSKLQLADMQTLEQLVDYIFVYDCSGVGKLQLADVLLRITDSAPQPLTDTAVWRIRFMAADLDARGGKPVQAQALTAQIWATGVNDPAVGILLARLQVFNKDFNGARVTLDQLSNHIPAWNRRGQTALAAIQKSLPH